MAEEKFTIKEIKNYILSQDSLGDVLHNLKAENIEKANGYESSTRDNIVEHEDLYEIFVEEGFDHNFKFKGSDGNIYLFNVDQFDYLIKEYGQSPVVETITLNNGSIERMVELQIAKPLK